MGAAPSSLSLSLLASLLPCRPPGYCHAACLTKCQYCAHPTEPTHGPLKLPPAQRQSPKRAAKGTRTQPCPPGVQLRYNCGTNQALRVLCAPPLCRTSWCRT